MGCTSAGMMGPGVSFSLLTLAYTESMVHRAGHGIRRSLTAFHSDSPCAGHALVDIILLDIYFVQTSKITAIVTHCVLFLFLKAQFSVPHSISFGKTTFRPETREPGFLGQTKRIGVCRYTSILKRQV
jgi:hypothetical protein